MVFAKIGNGLENEDNVAESLIIVCFAHIVLFFMIKMKWK